MKILTIVLALITGVASAAFQIHHEKKGGDLLNYCEASSVNDYVYYSGNDCQVHMYEHDALYPTGGDPPFYYLNLGACGNKITKIIIDNKMYKVNYDVNLFKSFLGPDPEIYIDNYGGNKLVNCNSAIGLPFPQPQHPLLLNFTDSMDVMIMKSLIFGTDQFNRPVIIMDSFTGDIVCDNYDKQVITQDADDLIFENGFN